LSLCWAGVFWEHFTESQSATSKNEVSEKYGGWPMLKMSYSGFTAVQCFMQGLKSAGADRWEHQPVLAGHMKIQPDLT